ncbi:hypothetical protein [Corynebacterium suicordis]|uniref:Secreted protein n=1 Tax=Corynebacterium suicordis DSM 45110 TaxID=1121369 RepID=A0ABR9ZIQ0_9CORY|nr:hypothetical protein [Corynebacterium suicordis]MBF4552522.1 hypothetical protein [Corynebacterium suicordis DSM 45110]MDR6278519.1 outer membrane protein assembly factor BamB [Corynebacterium suicordis]
MNTQRTRHPHTPIRLIAALATTGLALTACSTETANPGNNETGSASVASKEKKEQTPPEETAGPTPRLVTTYDGGLLALDANTLKVLDRTELEGFNRLNPLGDGHSLLVSTKEGFRVFDAGSWTEPHGDHTHSYKTKPLLTDILYPATKPGHVVHSGGRTLIFGDDDGSIQELKTAGFASGYKLGTSPRTAAKHNVTPHHGVAVPLPDGGMLRTDGTEDERHTVLALNKDGREIAKSEKCPGVHGEAIAAGGAVTVGCQDGILIYRDGKFQKVDSPAGYGRIGNQAGSEESAVVLGDYKADKAAADREELERPTHVTLTDTSTGQMKVVDVKASYSFRSLGRGPAGEALVLGTDGMLRKLDPATGAITGEYPVVKAWQESKTWQDPRPTLFVQDGYAFVTEPATKMIHKVDIATGTIVQSAELLETPNELSGVEG